MTVEAPGNAYAAEIREWLVGRIARRRQRAETSSVGAAKLPRRASRWWILEGKRYPWLASNLASAWSLIGQHVQRLLATYNPAWRMLDAPEGETDWVATAFSSVTASRPTFVSKASRSGLGDDERQALLGWMAWLSGLWHDYIQDVGPPEGIAPELPWVTPPNLRDPDTRTLQRWAHTAKRSRWPLLRNVVAESLRCELEPQELDALPLPSDHATLFELLCMVRILRCLEPKPGFIRWLDRESDNAVRIRGMTFHFQYSLPRKDVLESPEYDDGLREAIERDGVRAPKHVDGLLVFDQPRAGFRAILLEAKSGEQEPDTAIYQLKAYRAALKATLPGRYLILGVVEQPRPAVPALVLDGEDDVWIFCDAAQLPQHLGPLRAADV